MPFEPKDLQDTLTNPTMTEAFRKFLDKEHTPENLAFHEAVTQFKVDLANPEIGDEQIRTQAKQMFTKFVDAEGAKVDFSSGSVDALKDLNLQVNLSGANYKAADNVNKKIGTASREEMGAMFDGAHEEVLAMTEKDSYTRFQKSEGFTSAVKQVNDTRAASIKPETDKIKALETKLDKLKAPGMAGGWERFKAVFNGGEAKVKQDTIDQIDKLKMQAFQKADPEDFAKLQKQNQKSLETLRADQQKLVPALKEHQSAARSLKEAQLFEDVGKKNMSPEDLRENHREQRVAKAVMKENRPAVDGALKNEREIDSLKKNVSTRETLASQTKKGPEGPKVSGPGMKR